MEALAKDDFAAAQAALESMTVLESDFEAAREAGRPRVAVLVLAHPTWFPDTGHLRKLLAVSAQAQGALGVDAAVTLWRACAAKKEVSASLCLLLRAVVWRAEEPVATARGVDPREVPACGITALHLAVVFGDLALTEDLLARGATVDATDAQGRSAADFGEPSGPIATRLRSGGAVPVFALHQQLLEAVDRDDPAAIRAVVARGADPARRRPANWLIRELPLHVNATPLHFAARRNRAQAIRALVALGVPVDVPAVAGSTPLIHAADAGSEDAVRVLLELGAVTSAVGEGDGRSALHVAAVSGHVGVVRVLVEGGASSALRDRGGKTPLDLAAAKNHVDAMNAMLAANGADLPKAGAGRLVASAMQAGAADVLHRLLAGGAPLPPLSRGPAASTIEVLRHAGPLGATGDHAMRQAIEARDAGLIATLILAGATAQPPTKVVVSGMTLRVTATAAAEAVDALMSALTAGPEAIRGLADLDPVWAEFFQTLQAQRPASVAWLVAAYALQQQLGAARDEAALNKPQSMSVRTQTTETRSHQETVSDNNSVLHYTVEETRSVPGTEEVHLGDAAAYQAANRRAVELEERLATHTARRPPFPRH